MGIWGWWAFDIFTLICSYLSVAAISAQTVMRSLGLLTFMLPVGLMVSSGIMLGENIGKGDIPAIKHYYRVCLLMAGFIGLGTILLLVPGRDLIISIFTQEEEVVQQM